MLREAVPAMPLTTSISEYSLPTDSCQLCISMSTSSFFTVSESTTRTNSWNPPYINMNVHVFNTHNISFTLKRNIEDSTYLKGGSETLARLLFVINSKG